MLDSFFKKVSIRDYTTSKIGPVINYFCLPKNQVELLEVIDYVKNNNLSYYILGGGSNTIFDENLDSSSVVICLKDYREIREIGGGKYLIKAGTPLQKVIDFAKDHKLSGLTTLNRIPGSLGGAVVGNAGAYGHEIKEVIQSVRCLDLITLELITLDSNQSQFAYRDSYYKKNLDLLVLEVLIVLDYQEDYTQELDEYTRIAGIRDVIYPVGFCSPGSVFKNILVKDLKEEVLAKISQNYIIHNKVSVGKLLESIGAKGRRYGDVMMRLSHANIMEVVTDKAKFSDVLTLLKSLKEDVYKEYGIELVEEIRLVKEFKKLV